MKELLPCPFCGGKARYQHDVASVSIDTGESIGDGIHFILCNDCSAVISAFTEDDVVDAWNTRALPANNLIIKIDKENLPWLKQ